MKKQKVSDIVLIQTSEKIASSLLKADSIYYSKVVGQVMKATGTLQFVKKDARVYLENFIKEKLHFLVEA